MGTIIYDPHKKNKDKQTVQENKASVISVEEARDRSNEGSEKSEERYNTLIENIDSVRPMGDTDCDYVIYLEDYVYTYIYQYANTDLSCEHSAAIIGEYYPESREMIICGIMPIDKDKLSTVDEWINEEAVEALQEEKESYFQGAKILGWLHMQPGYGTMLTMKEVKAHREIFDREGTLLLLVDPINKIETFYVYEDDTLKEQSGYYMYYDKNPCMQQYMLDRPFISVEKEETEDDVVNQFREIGKIRKKEYEHKKKMNLTVVAASIALLALSAVILKMNDQNAKINGLQAELAQMSSKEAATGQDVSTSGEEANAQFVFNPEGAIDAATPDVTIIDRTGEEANAPKEEVTVDKVVEEEVEEVAQEKPAEEKPAEETPVTNEEQVDIAEEAATTNKEGEQAVEAATQEEDYITYVVQEGDSLRKISFDHYQTELRTKEIIALNEIENGDDIYVGQKLKLPAE
ncbi:LysM peptidoglycan-binding domain-containing protein [Zhenhengia yiwuensis]|uniref:LysM peptidoglycan-binding domain-containing protein n=1 Tax=Zhenhengia yiwuensis TaxID=2763666 RepID=A0A926EKB7_9FIRM|nr:LysM peptidoglycan-binding domain-containing protein [Zhenhengia yiwuensis]MBC8580095.1 LysM peptidoglycan-binding domain-containing protein [Zhenhengia yiwuensis]